MSDHHHRHAGHNTTVRVGGGLRLIMTLAWFVVVVGLMIRLQN